MAEKTPPSERLNRADTTEAAPKARRKLALAAVTVRPHADFARLLALPVAEREALLAIASGEADRKPTTRPWRPDRLDPAWSVSSGFICGRILE